MTRSLTAAVQAELTARVTRPVFLAELEFASGTVRAWSGIGDLLFQGNTFTGTADLGIVSPVGEATEVRAEGMSFELSGIPSSAISLALGQARRNKPATLWLGFMDEAGNLIGDPFKLFSGRIDAMDIAEGAESASVTVTAESVLADLKRPRARRFTDEDQKIDFPDDKGLEFVAGLQDKNIVWGGSGAPQLTATTAPKPSSQGAGKTGGVPSAGAPSPSPTPPSGKIGGAA